ncbi:hypothetical protein ACSEO6_24815 [Pseudomonas aeruginosa]
MARKSSLDALPKEVKTQLVTQYRQNPAWTFVDHTQWLVEQGYNVSKTAVWRFLTTKGDKVLDEILEDQLDLVRLRCLEVASKHSEGATPSELIEFAEQLLRWVNHSA